MYVLTHLGALIFVGEDLGLGLRGRAKGGHFVLDSVIIAVVNLVSEQVLAGGAVVENDGISGTHNSSLLLLHVAKGWMNCPHGVIHLLVLQADLLVA